MHSALRDSRAPRTNQFKVNDRINGLDEKFRILNNDELADALQSRLVELSNRSLTKTPEILAFFLQLSENPVDGTKIEELGLLKKPAPSPRLTWDQVLADDPFDNAEGIWDSVNFSADSSEEDDIITPEPTFIVQVNGGAIGPHNGRSICISDAFKLSLDMSLLQEVHRAQFWREQTKIKEGPSDVSLVTETQVVREVVFMLHGLPTTIFDHDDSGQIRASHRYRIERISDEALQDLLCCFTSVGHKLAIIREWANSPQIVPVVQILQATLRENLQGISVFLSEVETHIIHPSSNTPVTLLSLLSDVRVTTRPLLLMIDIIPKQKECGGARPFEYLDSLYELICSSESLGDAEAFVFFRTIFTKCFQIYLKSIEAWMERGELPKNHGTLFVKQKNEQPLMASLWLDQYELIHDASGSLHSPRMVRSEAQKIFKTGKSTSFLLSLGIDTIEQNEKVRSLPKFDIVSIYELGQAELLGPFPELFSSAFGAWVAQKHERSALLLRNTMETRCGLGQTLDALEYIYFARNGALASQVAVAIFERIDRRKKTRNDQFILTEHFRRAYGQCGCVSISQLSVRTLKTRRSDPPGLGRSMGSLSEIIVEYRIPWAIANIVTPASADLYQRIFVLLLQLRRAKQLLERNPFGSASLRRIYGTTSFNVAFALRHRLLWITNTLYSYLTSTVLLNAASDFRAKMGRAGDLDAMIVIHARHISHLEEQCLLSNRLTTTLQAVVSLLDLAVLFSEASAVLDQESSTAIVPPRDSQLAQSDTSSSEDEDPPQRSGAKSEAGVALGKLRKMSSTFSELLIFVLAGLREAYRNGAEPCWGVLIDDLAVGVSQ